MFALVHFEESDDVAVVPVHWLTGKYCFWPNSKDVGKLAKTMANPKPDWQKHEVVVKSIYASYDEARHFETKFEMTSNLDTEEEDLGKGKRSKKRKRCTSSSASSDEESLSLIELPPCPVVEKQLTNMPVSIPIVETLVSPNRYTVLAENRTPLSQPKSIESSDSNSAVMREILHLKLQMKQQNEMLSAVLVSLNTLIERTSRSERDTTSNVHVLPVKLPLTNMEELSTLEKELHSNEVKEQLYEVLRQTGGVNLGNIVRRMLSKLMSNELASKFSWLGAKEKEAFNSLEISKLIFSATRENSLYTRVTDQEVETIIKDWLRHAKSRKNKLKENERETL